MKRMISTGALALALALGGGWWLSQQASPTVGGEAIALPGAANAQEADAGSEEMTITEMTLGAEDAPVEVIEYASYTCPHCATFHQNVFKNLKADYIDTGKVKFTYREVYFDRYGLWGSLVARCGGEEKFFGITDLIYKGQQDWARAGSDAAIAEELRKIGRIAGLESEQLEACLSDGAKAKALVGWYQENVAEHDISSTPSFVIDGEKYSNMGYDEMKAILDDRLN